MKSVGEIKELVNRFNLRHQDLFNRMDEDYDWWQLKEKQWIDKWAHNITLGNPRIFSNALMQTIGEARLKIAVHREDKNAKKEAKMEKVIFSALDRADDRLANRLMPPLRSTLAFLAAHRRFVSGRVLVYVRDKEIIVDILPYDPRFLAYGYSARGMEWSGYSTWRDPETIEYEYKKEFASFFQNGKKLSEVQIIEFWDDEFNNILIGNEFVTDSEKESKHELERPPVIVIPCGSTPLIVGTEDRYAYVKNWGESIYDGGRTMLKPLNQLASIAMDVAEKSDRPGAFVKLEDEKQKVVMPWGTGEVTTLPMQSEVIQIQPPETARVVMDLFSVLSQDWQRATYPHLRFGQTWKGQEWSGEAIQTALRAPERVVNPVLSSLSRWYKQAIYMIIEQYQYTGMKWDAVGRDSKGRFFQETIKPGDIEGKFTLEVEFVSITPEEDANNLAKAQMMKEAGLASNKHINEKVIQFQDYETIENQLREQEAEMLNPKIKILRTIDSLRAQGRKDEANLMAADFIKQLHMEQVQDAAGIQDLMGRLQAPEGAPEAAPPATEEEVRQRLESTMGGAR